MGTGWMQDTVCAAPSQHVDLPGMLLFGSFFVAVAIVGLLTAWVERRRS